MIRKNTEQIVLSFDEDNAGQTAKMRAIEILQTMGIDIRILELEGAKDPDEYVIKFGQARFLNTVQKAISVVEFKAGILKKELDLDNVSDKIKFLNEIARILAKVENSMEREIYIESISRTHNISKEAIHSEISKIVYSEKKQVINSKYDVQKTIPKVDRKVVSEKIVKRENAIIGLILTENIEIGMVLKENVKIDDFKDELNKEIARKIYEEIDKGNCELSNCLDKMSEEEQGHISKITIEDHEIDKENIEKAIDDLLKNYQIEKYNERKIEILTLLEEQTDNESKISLEKELSDIIITLAKIK